MKVLGISFGRKMQNCDILVKEALMKAEKAGAEVKFINTVDMKIDRCTGCGACSAGRSKGKQIRCIIKDDYQALEEAVLEADGIVVAAPVYVLGPVGQMKNFIDRFGPAHDRAAVLAEQEKRKAKGDVELLDERIFTDKYVAYISVGGAYTKNWVSLGLPYMALFGMSTVMKTVGHYNCYDMGRTASPFLDENVMKRAADLGEHVAKSIGKPYDKVEWMGDEGACPVCHNEMITVAPGTTTVECPICGIEGKLSIEKDEVKIEFSEEQKNRARNTLAGLTEHYLEIENMKTVCIPKIMENKEFLDKKRNEYKEYNPSY